jgi:GNAT superfamily N-acetyltransferase
VTAPLCIRPATPSDAEAVVALVQDAYRGEGGERRWTTEAHLVRGHRTTARAVRAHIAAVRSVVLMANDDLGLLACCHLKALDDGAELGAGDARTDRAYFGLFAVRPASQGGGVGRTMVATAEEWARDRWGASVMEMQVIEGREELLAWYDRLGYRRTERTIPFRVDNEDDRPRVGGLQFVVLEKRLTP